MDNIGKIPGLVIDKLQAVFGTVHDMLLTVQFKGIVFAYDEAQNLPDHAATKEFPLSLLLDLFSSFQRKYRDKLFLLVFTGLPILFPKLNESRTYTKRMFHVIQLDRLSVSKAKLAVIEPLNITNSTLRFGRQ